MNHKVLTSSFKRTKNITSKKLIMYSLFTLSTSLSTITAQSWLWARQGKNHTTLNDGAAIAIDNLHSAYLTGSYSDDTLILGSDTLFASTGTGRQTFLMKYDENGNLLWASSSQSTSNQDAYATAVAIDIKNNVYITGEFYDTLLFFQSFAVTNKYNPLVFITKYDANGNVKWAKQCTRARGRGDVNCGEGLVTDKAGNLYVTGFFTDTISFGSYILRTSYAGTFLVKYDSNGNVLWAKQSNSINHDNASNFITIDKSGYVYISGYFQDTVVFGTQILTAPSLYDAYIVKYDSDGNVIWARQSTHTGSKSYAEGYGICTDKENNIYTTGFINDTIKFGTTTLTSPRNQYYSIYWTKYDSSGNVLWAKQSYDLDLMEWFPGCIASDVSENLYLTGDRDVLHYSNAEVVFDSDTLKLNNAGSPMLFLKMDSSGTVLNGYLFQLTPAAGGGEEPLAVDSSGCYVYYGGDIDTSVVFGNDTVGKSVNPSTIDYPFIARWTDGECAITTGNKTIEGPYLTANLYPNPNNGIFTLVCHSEQSEESLPILQIYNVLGGKVLTETLRSPQSDNTINLSNEPSGVYLYRITDQQSNLISTGKFIIQ
jgi:hypothetical protein